MPMLMGGLAGMIEHLKLTQSAQATPCKHRSLYISRTLSFLRQVYVCRLNFCVSQKGLKFPISRIRYIVYWYWCLNNSGTNRFFMLIFHQNISKSPRTYKQKIVTFPRYQSIARAISFFQKVRSVLEEPVHDFCSKMFVGTPTNQSKF